ncbi:uncharacterized protein LOC135699431 [Ochlerotatus camptorhynchus]|uniref:uncharacterized protein LOC135699431 n=1 Tax=Ochlerotatus camptorhynchus TaxID=644619 RepID=UPI0031D5ED79
MVTTANEYCNIISASECEQIVINSLSHRNISIRTYKIRKIPGHLGFLGEYFQLEIVVEEGETQWSEHYFLKSLPIADTAQRAMMEGLGFFRKEVRIYSDILVNLNQQYCRWHPACYYTRDDLIVMEDMTLRHGFRMVHFNNSLEQAHIYVALQAVARMHAASLNYEVNHLSGRRLDDVHSEVLFETTVSHQNSWFLAGLSAIKAVALNGTRYCKDPDKKKIIEEQLDAKLDRVFEVVKPTDQFQNVLVHRDLWHNNLMFRFEKDPLTGSNNLDRPNACVLVDFQICRYLPPVVDFLQVLFLTTRRSHRDQHFQHYLEFYHSSLTSELRRFELDADHILNWNQLERSLHHYLILAHIFSGIYLQVTNLPEHLLDELHRNDPELYNQYCNVNRDGFVLKCLQEDDFYRETLTECVEEMLEYIFGF